MCRNTVFVGDAKAAQYYNPKGIIVMFKRINENETRLQSLLTKGVINIEPKIPEEAHELTQTGLMCMFLCLCTSTNPTLKKLTMVSKF